MQSFLRYIINQFQHKLPCQGLLVLFLAICGYLAQPAHAEGSKELTSQGGNRAFLLYHSAANPRPTIGGIPLRTTIKVYVNAGETINLGSSANGIGSGVINYRTPTGSAGSCPAPGAGNTGKILNRSQEQAGPLPNVGGYTPCIITSVQTTAAGSGVWEIDFVSPSPTVDNNPTGLAATAAWTQANSVGWVAAWDVTVRNSTNTGSPFLGRVYANSLALRMPPSGASFSPNLYVQTQEGYRYLINPRALDPFTFVFFANNNGFKSSTTNAPLYRSVLFPGGTGLEAGVTVHDPNAADSGNNVTHKVFFNSPNADLPTFAFSASGTTWLLQPPIAPQPTSLTFTGIEGTAGQAGTTPLGGNFSFNSNVTGRYQLILDLNKDGIYGNGNDRILSGFATLGSNSIFWDGKDNGAVTVPASAVPYGAQIVLYAGEIHFPLLDAEQNPSGFTIQRINEPIPATIPSPNPYTVYFNDAVVGGSSAVNGVNSSSGVHSWTSGFGDNKGLDTWTYYPSGITQLNGGILIRQADLEVVSKTHAPAVVNVGNTITYTIVVRNNGISDSTGATFIDQVPASITGVTWNCTVSPVVAGNSCGAASGTGNTINTTLNLKNGAAATYIVTGIATSSGPITNTAKILRSSDITDPDDINRTGAGNNSKSDSLTVNPASPVSIFGSVFGDTDGSKAQNGIEVPYSLGGLNAVIVNGSNQVVATTTVAANGTYSFSNITANLTYTVQITTASAVVGLAPPVVSLPSNWVSTGENLNGIPDTTIDGKQSITVGTNNVTNVNFGIEQLPNTVDLSPVSQANPGNTTTVQVPTLAGTDPEDGALGSGKTFKIVTLPTNGTLTYNGIAVTAGQTIASYNPALLQLDPNDGAITVSFTYAAVDAAGQVDTTPATVTMPFTTVAQVAVSGLVFSDADASVTINGSDAGTNAGSANLTVYAIDTTGKVVDKATVAANGIYSLTSVPVSSIVTLRLSNDASVAIGATAPIASSIPSGWVNTGENKNGVTETITLGDIAVTVASANISNQNFGIEQLPNTTNLTPSSQTNPGGTATVPVPTLAGTDPEDGTLGSGKTFQIVTLPTNGTLYYNSIAVTAGQLIPNYDPTLLKLDPTPTGAVTVTFTYGAVDAAGKPDPTPATVSMDFNAPALGSCDIGGGTVDPAISPYISPEVDGTSVAARAAAESLDDAWRTAAGLPQTGTVQPWFGTTTGNVPNNAPNLFTTNGVSVGVALVDLAPATNCTGTVNSGSTPQLVQTATLQGNAPRPSSLFDSLGNHPSYWNENVGSSTSRNAILFTFSQPVSAFGAWFSDVETRTDGNGTPALLRLLDAAGNRIGNDIPITPTTISNGGAFAAIDQSQCGVTATDRGCGNSSTRWIGFVDASARVKQVLVIVGDDDFGDVGNTEHMGFIGANIVPSATYSISGTIFNDRNGSKVQNAPESGTNAGGLNAILVDSTNKVIATTPVVADGTYAFSNVPANADYTVLITTNPATINSPPPVVVMPSNWVSTGENLGNNPDATVDSQVSVSVGTSNVTGVNFGIEQLPNTTDLTPSSQTNPGGTATVPVPTLVGTDPEDGALGSGNTFKIVTLPTNGMLIYNNGGVTLGQVISNYDPSLLKLDPTAEGPTTVSFTYAAVDAAGKADLTPATVTLPFTGRPNLLLVKRITAINNGATGRNLNGTAIDLTQFVNDPSTTDDNNANWTANYLAGAIDGGVVKNGDELEYTIYFLSNGTGTAKQVLLCDRIPDHTTFMPTGFNVSSLTADPAGLPGADLGIVLSLGNSSLAQSNIADGDRAQFFPPGVEPTTVYPNINCGGANTTGAVVVNIGDLPNATAPATPNTSYGFLRFRATVK